MGTFPEMHGVTIMADWQNFVGGIDKICELVEILSIVQIWQN